MIVNKLAQKSFSTEVRSQSKKIMTIAMGGQCCICGYKKCIQALELHHINPNEKDFHFNKVHITKNNWVKICNELRKCVLLCANCHREVHGGVLKIPETATKFDEKYADYEATKVDGVADMCPICSGPKISFNKTCSSACAAKYNIGKIDWNNIDLKALLDSGMSYNKISRLLGVSSGTVHKKAIRLGLKSKTSGANE